MAEEEAAEVPPEPVPPLSEEDLENRKACFDEVFAEFPALEVKQKSMAERKPAPPADPEGEEGVEQAPETAPNIALAYSELDFLTVNKLLTLIKEKCGPLYPSKGQFLDFGSGAGKVCVAAALAHPFEKVVGVEVLQSMNDAANAALPKYTEAALPEGVIKPEIQFIKGDFVNEFEPLEAVAAEVAVCIVVATTFGEPELQAMAKFAQKMPEGSSLVAVTQKLPEEMVVDVNRDPRKRRAAATRKALAKRGVEPVGIDVVPHMEPAENDPNGWRLKHTEDLELEWGTTSCYIYKKYTYPFCDPGDICMVTPLPEENDTNVYPAYFVSPTTATYMDDGTEKPEDVGKMAPFSEEDRTYAVKLYESKLAVCKTAEMVDSKAVVAAAFNAVKEKMGGSLGEDGKISYANDEANEGMLLIHTMIGNFGSMGGESKVMRFMAAKWEEACKEADVDGSGTISEEEAIGVWEKVKTTMSQLIMSKLDQLKA
eukprot:CAMPEP_0197648282 /NCGR_PEP_ID=MMETSP1338-20131121/27660_1 /TAXON_ID=43686 ORGANISM="Pelagodinium beii, Strain RCC1491" /NCGR_SAMPLE_ID=MMETSP1338 /ASSEMBLY_ACC=CAM_ASM_000754 /LENGTH=483 /DNA_ID=CAMNT_0043222257 /DNA_START=64 /DNA_END=1515 /DNA_ORIENTATION=+